MASFLFTSNPLTKRVQTHDAAAEGMMQSMGITDQHLREARAKLDLGHARRPVEAVAGDHEFHRRDRFDIVEVEKDGDVTIKRGYRPVGGGRVEQVEFREERVSDRSTLLKEVRR